MKNETIQVDKTAHGYYMYADGTSRWGIGVMRNGETPILVPIEIHNADEEKKLQFYKDTITAKQEKQAKKEEEEREEKKNKK
jgi:hypothetical protein